MRKFKTIVIVIVAIVAALLLVFFLVGYFKPKNAGVIVQTDPTSQVFINGEFAGRTPYEATLDPEEVVIKLVPDSFEKPLAPFETKIKLVSGIQTVIQRNFGESEEQSNGVIISFEKVERKEVSLSVISVPDAAQIAIDDQVKGFTPYKSSSITASDHIISVSSQNYQEKSVQVKTHEGYKLTAVFKLAPSAEEEKTEEEKIEEPKVTEILIKETPTGFLRVRSEPSTLSSEAGQVKPGEKYTLLEEDEKTGWYKINFQNGKEGWVSNEYTQKLDGGDATPSANLESSPKPTQVP